MEITPIVGLIGGIGVLATAFVTWQIATHTNSGRVATTDADRLWAQNELLIQALTTDNSSLRVRIDSLTSENDNLRVRMHTLEVKQHQTELAESECNERADRLQHEMAALKRKLGMQDEVPVERVVVKGEHLEAEGPEPAH